jgi:hypothetical protein
VRRARAGLIVLVPILPLLLCASFTTERVPVVATIADFDDDSVATTIASVQNVLRTACALKRSNVPARGQRSLQLEIGVTGGQASAVVDFRLRDPRRFDQADRIAAFYWLNEGAFDLAFRIRDARDQIFETPAQTVATANRWTYFEIALEPENLRRIQGTGEISWPIQLQGFRASTSNLGKQTIYLDEFQIEHHVERRAMIRGEFIFDQPTRIYEPGATVRAALALENCSRKEKLQVSVELAWTRPDGSVLKTQSGSKSLPPSNPDFRSRQSIDFSETIEQPGLYRLTARARASGWMTPAVFQTSIAVTPRNATLSRGRSTFYGVRSGLVREPAADQRLEIATARDIGVHLLAVETPWQQIEPAAGKTDFAALDPVINELTAKGIAPLIVLTDPPEWAPAGEARVAAIAALFCKLAGKYGAALSLFQPEHDVLGSPDLAALPAALERIQAEVKKVREDTGILSPPIPATPHAATALKTYLPASTVQWCIQTEGDTHAALQALESFRSAAGLEWEPKYSWLHRAAPLIGPTHFVDAEQLLEHYVQAALAGVGGLIWYDLRDNDNDTGQPDALRGLVRRDFSPKASLLGYATAAGMLTGLACRGPVDGTPPEFQSALFVGSDRHLAVLLPRPNRIRPAVLAVLQGVAGKLQLQDFERRPFSPLSGLRTSLVPTLDRPFFITIPLTSPQPEPQLAFGQSPVSVPATLFCGETEDNVVKVTPLDDVRRGSLRLTAPPNSLLSFDFERPYFKAKQGETQQLPLKISRPTNKPFESVRAALKVTLDSTVIEIPVEARPLATIRPKAGGWPAQRDSFRLAELTADEGQRASARATVFAAYSPQDLELLIVLRDDRLVPLRTLADGTAIGDDLLLGVAGDHADQHAEIRIDLASDPPQLHPAYACNGNELRGWTCTALAGAEQEHVYHVQIPSQAFGTPALSPGSKLRLAIRYEDDDADGLSPAMLHWGRGLDGAWSSEGFRWVRLAESN